MLTSLLLFQATTGAPAPYTPPPQPPPGYVYPGQPSAPPPAYGAPPPGYGAPPPGYGAPPPGYGPPPPGYDANVAPPVAPRPPLPPREWIIRFHVGVGTVAHSEEDDALDKEGYGASPRFLAMIDGS